MELDGAVAHEVDGVEGGGLGLSGHHRASGSSGRRRGGHRSGHRGSRSDHDGNDGERGGQGLESQLAMRTRRPPEMSEMHYDGEVRKFGKRDGSEVVSGRWSKEEDDRLRLLVREFVESKGSSLEEYRESLSVESRTEDRPNTKHFKGVWVHCAAYFPRRTVESIRHRGERIFHPSFKKGNWSEEELAELKALVQQHGRRWVKLGALLDREPGSVRDKYRQLSELLSGRSKPVSARWSSADEEQLIELIKEAMPEWKAGNVPLHGIPWKEIADKMGRNKTAVMEKWHANLHGKVVGYKVRNWGYPEYEELIKAIRFSDAKEYDQVPWEDLPVRFSPAVCRRQWRALVKRKGLEDEPFSTQLSTFTLEYAPSMADKSMHQAASKTRRKRHKSKKSSKRKHSSSVSAADDVPSSTSDVVAMASSSGLGSEHNMPDTPSSPEGMAAPEVPDYAPRVVTAPVIVAPMSMAQQASLIMDSEDEDDDDDDVVGGVKRKINSYLDADDALVQDSLKHSRRDIAAMDPHAPNTGIPPPNSHDANISI